MMNAINLPAALLSLILGTVEIDGTGGSQPVAKPPRLHVFAGQPVHVDLSVLTPNGKPMDISADLFQKGQSLLAPIQKDIEVAKAINSAGFEPLRPLLTWTLSVPEVKRETEMVVRFRVKTDANEWRAAGQLFLTVYPPNFAAEDLEKIGKTPGLRVFGSDPLRKFLQAQKVDFDDAGPDLDALPAAPEGPGIFVGEVTTHQLTEWLEAHPRWKGNLVVFCSDAPLLPGVFLTTHQGGLRLAKVTMPMLDTLSTDPHSQKTLIDILNSITTP